MRTSIRTALAATAATLLTAGIAATAAAPAGAVASQPIGSGTLRAYLYEHGGYGGAVLTVRGPGSCTASTGDRDTPVGVVPSGWNDVISSARDYNSCDIDLYWNGGFGGIHSGFVNYGNGRSVPSGWNDEASSFIVS